MKVKPPIWTFDEEDQIKVLRSARHEQHSLAVVEPALGGDDDRLEITKSKGLNDS